MGAPIKIRTSILPRDKARFLGDLTKMEKSVMSALVVEVKGGADEVVQKAKDNVPVKTGRLRSAIRKQPVGNSGMSYEVIADTEYAAFVEFGTGRRGAATAGQTPEGYSHGGSGGQRASRFMERAVNSTSTSFFKKIFSALRSIFGG